MSLFRRFRRWLFLQELASIDLQVRRLEDRLSMLHRLLDVMEEPTLLTAVEVDLNEIVQIRQEIERRFTEGE